MKIRFTSKAIGKLSGIQSYFKDIGQAKVGKQIRAKIIEKIKSLKTFPMLGPEDETLKNLGVDIRYLVSENHKILYRVDGNEVIILNVFDTRQDPKKLKE